MVHWRGIWVRKQSGGSRFSACISKRTACENASNLIIMNDTKTVGPTQNSYLDDSRSWSLTMGWRIQQDRNFILPRSYMATTSWPFEGHVYRIPYHANTLEGNVNFRRLKHMRAWPEKVSSIEHCQQNIVLVPLTETNIFETKRGHLFRSWIANYKTKQMKMQGCRFPTEVGQPFWHVHHGWWPSDVRRVETRGQHSPLYFNLKLDLAGAQALGSKERLFEFSTVTSESCYSYLSVQESAVRRTILIASAITSQIDTTTQPSLATASCYWNTVMEPQTPMKVDVLVRFKYIESRHILTYLSKDPNSDSDDLWGDSSDDEEFRTQANNMAGKWYHLRTYLLFS